MSEQDTTAVCYRHPLWKELKTQARKKQARIVLCEGTDERVIRAAGVVTQEKLARVLLIGEEREIREKASYMGIDLEQVEFLAPGASGHADDVAAKIFELRRAKGMTEQQAKELACTSLPFGFGLLALGRVDAAVAGAVATTAETVRSAMTCLGTAKGHKITIGLFLVETPYAPQYGSDGIFIFADCGVTPDPSPRMLVQIAREAADACSFYLKIKPRVAFLSFSTKGSAAHEKINRVTEAVALARKQLPEIILDGEFQLDTALDADIARMKGVRVSPVAGKANVLIFPDLDAGNITYKAIQRLGRARTIGPILWGLQRPASDLSRGCSVDDIVQTVCAVCARV